MEIWLENLPLVILTIIFGILFHWKSKLKIWYKPHLKLILASIFGLIIAKTILFFQWYWIIAPEYRNVPGDMSEGLAWTIFLSVINIIVIASSYLIIGLAFKLMKRNDGDLYKDEQNS